MFSVRYAGYLNQFTFTAVCMCVCVCERESEHACVHAYVCVLVVSLPLVEFM